MTRAGMTDSIVSFWSHSFGAFANKNSSFFVPKKENTVMAGERDSYRESGGLRLRRCWHGL
jgi:hypothetical protein